jgi:hypothetical protein
MGGNLTLVCSQEGVGSKFSIMIPVLERLKSTEEQEDDDLSSSIDENDLSFTFKDEGSSREE